MAISGTINLYDLGFRFYHDPNLHYEITPSSQIRIDPSNGRAKMYFGMRDYLVEGVRTRKNIRVVQGASLFFIEPIDENGQTNWEGVKNIHWGAKGCGGRFDGSVSAPERISEYYNADTAATNDGTRVRVSLLLSESSRVKYRVRNSSNGDTRTVDSYNTTSVTLNKNEYIYGVYGYSDYLMDRLSSGIGNAFPIYVDFDLAYDFTGQQRGLNLFTMPDTAIQVTETTID